ncbi:hypothetical protein G4L39_04450 [Limisphaera ngatamarikiensis]|uniref:Uncharacterized protein n=1 Tax=Limisphaera ngatamarikiensis TaxID=1324935 RepID=A0A6M1RM80_9BACT|nr:hypothetical protein [Limisphaera ngatamarikiensis]NGO38649.1 hypothetical protein [Limisphaera ngatamarikiensis]
MADQARVTSIEAIEAFRNRLILFRDRASRILDEVSETLTRTRNWLDHECPERHRQELRRLQRQLEQKEQELFSARLSPFQETAPAEQAAVQRLRRAIEDVEHRLRRVRSWQQQFEPRIQTQARQIEKLRHHLDHDLGRALNFLTEAVRSLAAYAELHPAAAATGSPATPANPDTTDTTDKTAHPNQPPTPTPTTPGQP